jgi:hypothetical protein
LNTAALNTTLSKNARWVALALFVITVITRIPFASQYLYHWDSVNMAFGIREFNVLDGAPQFPGYIVYIVIAQLVNVVFNDPQTTMLVISIISSGLAVAVIFYLGRDLFNPTSGLIAALFLLTSPLFWFYGEIALPHTLDLFAVTYAAWLLYRIMQGEHGLLWWTVIFLALLGGFRQQDLLFMGPLLLFCCYRVGLRKLILAALLGAAVSLAWFIPLIMFAGGLQTYLSGSSAFTQEFFTTTSLLSGAGLFGLRRNVLEKLLPYTAYAWSLAALGILGWLPALRGWRAGLRDRRLWFFALWMAPTIGFYVIIHMGQQGLVFVFLPALLLLSAQGLYRLLNSRPMLLRATALIIALISAAVFLLAPSHPLGKDRLKLLTYATLREADQLMGDKIAAVRENFQPQNTLLLAANWRHLQYYLPEYRFARFNIGAKFEVEAGQPTSADFVGQPTSAEAAGLTGGQDWQIVVMDEELRAFAAQSLQEVELPNGFRLAYLSLAADALYVTDGATFGAQMRE